MTLEESVLEEGWPLLEEARGRVLFHFNNVGGTSPYTEGHPNLEKRIVFPNAAPGHPNSGYHGRDEVLELFPAIQDLVRRGYLIRTRSDISLTTVRSGDTKPAEAALASGAQMISTDFPTVGQSARYGTDFVVQLPGGLPARCNPVSAPPRCRSAIRDAAW
jgi:Phosphoinositide phospholipase C, Ca2+-dependent